MRYRNLKSYYINISIEPLKVKKWEVTISHLPCIDILTSQSILFCHRYYSTFNFYLFLKYYFGSLSHRLIRSPISPTGINVIKAVCTS